MDFAFLTQTPLFQGLVAEELREMLPCLDARERDYQKGETICHAGDVTHELGLVETGSVNIIVNFYWGGSSIFSHVERGSIFAETYAAIPGSELKCDVVAAEGCRILFLNMDKLMTVCASGCSRHNQVIHNLVRLSAIKNLSLSTRMMHTAPKSIRERLLSYLSEQQVAAGSPCFSIPFSRQELADYLGVDRSALSATLSKMQKDGLITFRKNAFTLHGHTGQAE